MRKNFLTSLFFSFPWTFERSAALNSHCLKIQHVPKHGSRHGQAAMCRWMPLAPWCYIFEPYSVFSVCLPPIIWDTATGAPLWITDHVSERCPNDQAKRCPTGSQLLPIPAKTPLWFSRCWRMKKLSFGHCIVIRSPERWVALGKLSSMPPLNASFV